MAKNKETKEPGQIKQIIMVLKRTIELDRKNFWFILGATLLVLGTGTFFTTVSYASGDWLSGILLTITTILSTLLAFTWTLSRRAEKAAFDSWEGQAGATGAVLQTLLRRNWRGSDQPVSVNPRSMDLVYRVVGKPGIVLVGEGRQAGAQALVDAERKKLQKIAPGVPVHTVYVTESERAVKLPALLKTIRKFPKKLNRAEIRNVANRLNAIGMNLPIPKGIDPRRARPVRK
jgi:hypothetical protein